MQASSNEQMLTMKQVAYYMNVSSRTVMRWLESGWLKGTRIGGVIRIHPEDLNNLISDKVIAPKSEATEGLDNEA